MLIVYSCSFATMKIMISQRKENLSLPWSNRVFWKLTSEWTKCNTCKLKGVCISTNTWGMFKRVSNRGYTRWVSPSNSLKKVSTREYSLSWTSFWSKRVLCVLHCTWRLACVLLHGNVHYGIVDALTLIRTTLIHTHTHKGA